MSKLVLCLFLVQFLGANAQVQGSLRLVGSTSPNGGRLEVYINGHWGTVCDDSWGYNDARVACRQLGYTGVVTTLTSSFPSRSSSQRIWLDNVRCTGYESKLISCSHNGYGIEDCDHSEDVGIYCTARYSNGDIRLVGGNSYRGRVEVYYSGRWRTACYSGWDSRESTAVCKQLGYTGVRSTTSVYTSVSSSNKASVSCSSGASSLHSCSISLYCSNNYQPSVECTNSSNGDIRLVGGNSYRGRVEVYYSGQWRTACYSGWDSTESTAVCQQLGYTGVRSTTSVYIYVSSSNKASVSCSSGVSSLHSCRISLYCSSSYQPSVECTISTTSQHSNGNARLVGGSSLYEGRVEVYYNGEWRTACYSGWDYDASSIVCKQLGYGLVARVTSTYTRSSSDSVSVYCNGYETSLSECRISSYSSYSGSYRCYSQTVVRCTNSNVYAPLVWTILIPLVCGLIVLCVLCVPCVVAYCLYRKKKPRASPVPGNTAEGTVYYTASDEQSRVGYPTLPPTDREGEVQINYHSGDSGQIGVDTTVGPGLVVMDQSPEDIESPPPSIQQD